MSGISNYWRNKLLSHGFGKEVYVVPSLYYVALSLTNPLGTGLEITEPVGGSYSRVSTLSSNWGDVASFEIHNFTDITFEKATASWGLIGYFALFDQLTGGNMLAYGNILPAVNIGINTIYQFLAGDLSISY